MSRAQISKEIELDAGHRVPTHEGKCRSPHGHRYKVRVTCEGPIIEDPTRPDCGMLVDFSILKDLMMDFVHEPLDHGMIIWDHDTALLDAMTVPGQYWKIIPFPYIPTAENIARWIWEVLGLQVLDEFRDDLRVVEVAVWETPTSVAYYRGESFQPAMSIDEQLNLLREIIFELDRDTKTSIGNVVRGIEGTDRRLELLYDLYKSLSGLVGYEA